VWALIAVFWLGLALCLALAYRGRWTDQLRLGPHCPDCETPLDSLGGPRPERSYEVLVCRSCSHCATAVHGTESACAYCPNCTQRALETPLVRLPAGPEGPRVRVAETCHLCGHQDQIELPASSGERQSSPSPGKVLPFPGRSQRERRMKGDQRR
jgi:hypothetical protein